ncbi:phosphodiesterase [Jiangella endophytica]|uniref:phosphodiesterase n=1 Tax=Jiangella endophytica TaxID=1623398 RepID=UPI000E345F7F|nr:phosphodiesterase [Jiangella endophytica]
MSAFGQYPAPDFTLVHLSDTHFLADREALFGRVDTDHALAQGLERLTQEVERADAIVVTGDIADRGEPGAYDRVAAAVRPAAERLGAEVLWVMGNHDERPAFAERLYGAASAEPQNRVTTINGLRVVALDSSVPGYHHGRLDDSQLSWLADVLAESAPHGTVLALHHPPLPSRVGLMGLVELRDQERLAAVLDGTDVRIILAGHLHYSTFGTFAGIPVAVAAATCYTIDPLAGRRALVGVDRDHAFSIVELYRDRVVSSVVPAAPAEPVTGYSAEFIARLAAMTSTERDEAFSRKTP